MSLRELLLQMLLGTAEIVREALRHTYQRRLRTALFHLDREDWLVKLRVARVIQSIFHVRVLEQGRDQRVDHRIVRIQNLNADGILLFLENSELHESGAERFRRFKALRVSSRTCTGRANWLCQRDSRRRPKETKSSGGDESPSMGSPGAPSADTFESEAQGLLD